MAKVGIWLEDAGVSDILRYNHGLEAMEHEIAEVKMSEIRSRFLMEFGTEGSFEIKAVQTRPGKRYGRLAYRIVAADGKTKKILAKHAGWLAQFL